MTLLPSLSTFLCKVLSSGLFTSLVTQMVKMVSLLPWWLYFPGGSDGKASAYNVGDTGLIPGSGRSSEEGNGNPLQYSCLENPRMEECCRLQSMGFQRVRHDWETSLSLFTFHLSRDFRQMTSKFTYLAWTCCLNSRHIYPTLWSTSLFDTCHLKFYCP